MVFSICILESVDVEGQLYALFYTVLHKRFEHLQDFGIHGGSWNQSPMDMEGQF